MARKTEEKTLDLIINEMIDTVENSKDEVFFIGEESRREYDQLRWDLAETRKKVGKVIEEGDDLEQKVRFSRIRLSQVSKNFDQFTENEIKDVYDQTHTLQTELTMKRVKEKNLREKRDEIERRLLSLEQTVKRAEGLAGKISVVLNYLNDDFKHVSEMLQDAHEKQAFGLKIIEAQEEERRRLSREMHDGPAQMLANILLRSELVDRTFRERSVEEAMVEMKSVRNMVRTSLYEVRRLIYDLRPMALDDLGLVPTIKKYLANTEDYNQLKINFHFFGQERRLNNKYEVALFRLVQESVQNVVKHAEASEVTVKLDMKSDVATMVIKDDGKGFNMDEKKEKSFGIIGMRERVDILDGTIDIKSKAGQGTTVVIKIPLTDN